MNVVVQQPFLNTFETRQGLFKTPTMFNELQLDNEHVIQSCIHHGRRQGHMTVKDSTILFVLTGKTTIKCGEIFLQVNSGEMVILPKGIVVEYDKIGDADFNNLFEAIYFVAKDDLLKEFLVRVDLRRPNTFAVEKQSLTVKPVNERLTTFLASVKVLMKEKETVDKGLVKLKIFELLYDLAVIDQGMVLKMLQEKRCVPESIVSAVERHYLKPIGLPELAERAGRSLSTFKREFGIIYKSPPAKWIKEQRLQKARQLLQSTSMLVQVVCRETGFTNVSHFSRIFKKHFGYPPSERPMV